MDVFDPVQKQYRTLRTEPIPLRVTPAQAGMPTSEATPQNLLPAGGIRPIRLRLSAVQSAAPPWTQPWFWPLLSTPPFGLALLLGLAGLRRMLQVDPGEKRVRLARGAAARRLKGSRALLQRGESQTFYAEVARAVTGYLLDKQGLAVLGLTRDELAAALRQRGHGEDTVRRVIRVLDDCDRARFAPGSGDAPAREAMLGRADQLLNELDRGRS
jgi:hypothetical protein